MGILEEECSNDEVEEEKTTNQDEEYEENGLRSLILKSWPLVDANNV